MIHHADLSDDEVRSKIRYGEIQFGGNSKLKIYGTLKCKSGKRMKRENRIFFSSEKEAISFGYRPCGHCMKGLYKKWKNGFVQQ
ncbi:Ada metal-binding domain-containing protein [Allomuricauda sp. M10]|uniref:Ada metal-binding domain-containing protein n=1 Tax=Allomuricauda sp. M10 TaxID=2683292 RepID=UPI001D18EB5F|nr:Ada metal-binding domain-containing protein [Muricauda sp. M10]